MRLNKMSGKGSAHDPVRLRARVSVCWGSGWGAAAGHVHSAVSERKELNVLEDGHSGRPGRARRSAACSLHFRSVSGSVCCWYLEDKRLGCCCAHLGKKPRLGCEPQAPVQTPDMRSFLWEAACFPTGRKGGESHLFSLDLPVSNPKLFCLGLPSISLHQRETLTFPCSQRRPNLWPSHK